MNQFRRLFRRQNQLENQRYHLQDLVHTHKYENLDEIRLQLETDS